MASNQQRLDVYSVAERAFPGCLAAGTRWDVSMGADKVFMENQDGSRFEVFVKNGRVIGTAGKAARDPGQPGRKNKARRTSLNSWASKLKQTGAGRRTIGRRKTVSTSAKGLMSKKTRKAAKRAIFRMGQQAKLLPCHACARKDFATEKSLKRHVEKFHSGAKSPRGYRTRRDR